MDYCLDAGDGTAAIWIGPAELDLDGDGLLDDVFTDLDGDGLADHVALDLDDDGVAEARFTDDGSGTWLAGGKPGPLRWFGLDGVEHSDPVADLDADIFRVLLLDIAAWRLAEVSGNNARAAELGDAVRFAPNFRAACSAV